MRKRSRVVNIRRRTRFRYSYINAHLAARAKAKAPTRSLVSIDDVGRPWHSSPMTGRGSSPARRSTSTAAIIDQPMSRAGSASACQTGRKRLPCGSLSAYDRDDAAIHARWGSLMRRIFLPALGALLLIFVFAETASAQSVGHRGGWGVRHVGAWGAHRSGWRGAGRGLRAYVGYGWDYPWRPWAWGAGAALTGATAASPYGYGYPSAYPYGGVYYNRYGYPPCSCAPSGYFYPAAAGWGW